MKQKGGIWTNTFLHQKMMEVWKFRKRTRDLPMLSQLRVLWQHGWEGGKAAVGGYQGEVMKGPCYVPPVLEWEMDVMVMTEWCHATQGLLAQLMRWCKLFVLQSLTSCAGWQAVYFTWAVHPCHLCSSWSPWQCQQGGILSLLAPFLLCWCFLASQVFMTS